MYFPFLRGKTYELMALKELLPRLVINTNVMPIIEPVTLASSPRKSCEYFAENELPFILITNPKVGELSEDKCQTRIYDNFFYSKSNVIPALVVDSYTSVKNIDLFLTQYDHGSYSIVYKEMPDEFCCKYLAELADVRFHIFNMEECSHLDNWYVSNEKIVVLQNCFKKLRRNADYEDLRTEEFCVPSESERLPYAGFGDFSIVGEWTNGGGPAHAVALHHVYFERDNFEGKLLVDHFVSDETHDTNNTEGKFIQAVSKLLEERWVDSGVNHTEALCKLKSLFLEKHSPGLGKAKGLAIEHHLEVMLNFYDSRNFGF